MLRTGGKPRWFGRAAAIASSLVLVVVAVGAVYGASDGDGAMTVSPNTVVTGTTGLNLTFDYWNNSADNSEFSNNSFVQLTVPAGWTEPKLTGSLGLITVTAGAYEGAWNTCLAHVSPLPGPVSISGSGPWDIIIPMHCGHNDHITITYANVTAPAPQTYTFTTKSQDYLSGLKNIATSPTVLVQNVALNLDKDASVASFNHVGQVIGYTYDLTNTGDVALAAPFAVGDTMAVVTCPVASTLAPGAKLTCTASHSVIQADLDAGFVTNKASATAMYGSRTITSNAASKTVPAVQQPAVGLAKSATEASFGKAGDLIHYTYTLTNTGNVTLVAPFSVTDDKVAVACPVTASLAPTDHITCTAAYTVVQADVDAGHVTNTATASGHWGDGNTSSDPVQVTVNSVGKSSLTLQKTSTTTSFAAVGDPIHYSYVLTNAGQTTLSGPFSVTDNKVAVTCPVTSTLAPGAHITCTATYLVTQADLTARTVTNTATGHGIFLRAQVDSTQSVLTVGAAPTPTPFQTLLGATSNPTATPPLTSTAGGEQDGQGPQVALLICLVFGGLVALTAQSQRRRRLLG
jgi:hypothetical protein